MKKMFFCGVVLSAGLLLSACGEKLSEEVRFLPKEKETHLYEYTPGIGDKQIQEETYSEKDGDFLYVRDASGEIVSLFKEDETGLYMKYTDGLDIESMIENKMVGKLELDTLLEYPVKKGRLKINSDYTYKVASIDESLKTPYGELEGVVKIDLLYKNKDVVFTYYVKENMGIVGIESSDGVSYLQEIIKK